MRHGVEIKLRPKSFQVLEFLVRNAGRLVSREELMTAVWPQAIVTDGSLTQCMIDIRRAIEDDDHRMIRTVPRRGFILEVPVVAVAGSRSEHTGPGRPRPGRGRSWAARPWLLATVMPTLLMAVIGWWASGRTAGPGESHDLRARELFQQAQFFYKRRGPGDLDRARDYYMRVLEIQPEHAGALTGLAGVYRLEVDAGDIPFATGIVLQRDALQRALEANPNLAEAHARMGEVQFAMGDYEAARASHERAFELDPASPLVLSMRSFFLAWEGRMDEAISLQQRAAMLDPLSAVTHGNLAELLYAAGRMQEAEREWRAQAALNPSESINFDIGRIRVLQSRFGEAERLAAAGPPGTNRDQLLALAAPAAGHDSAGEAAMRRLVAARTRISLVRLAEVLAFRGRRDEAFERLSEGVGGSGPQPSNNDPSFDQACAIMDLSPFLKPLHDDPRWARLCNV